MTPNDFGEVCVTPGEFCQQCGLCCDGAVFTHAPLRKPEVREMESLNLPVVHRQDGTPAIELGCPALDGHRCTIYEDRPIVCRQFNCRLHVALREGELSFPEARAVLDEAHALISGLAEALPPPAKKVHPLIRARRMLSRGERLPDAAYAQWDRAESFLDRHFRGALSRVRGFGPVRRG